MKTQKYCCNSCGEIFGIDGLPENQEPTCARCSSQNLTEHHACSLEIGPPPLEYQCQQCNIRFRITVPRGPDEASAIRCPVCRSKNVKWLTLTYKAPISGG